MRLPTTKGDSRETLVSSRWHVPKSVEEIGAKGPSKHGWHSYFAFMGCLERARLRINGVHKAGQNTGLRYQGEQLTPLSFGSIWHLLLEAHERGRDGIEVLYKIEGIPQQSLLQIETMYLAYCNQYSRLSDAGYKVLGLEAEVKVTIPGTDKPFTVRYDKLLLSPKGHVINMDHKTASDYRAETILQWQTSGQIISQVWAWSLHPLAQKYGPIYQATIDIAVKRKNDPYFVREPIHISRHQIDRMGQDLYKAVKLRETMEKRYGTDSKTWPRSYECYGRYGACDFLNLCHYGSEGGYEKTTR